MRKERQAEIIREKRAEIDAQYLLIDWLLNVVHDERRTNDVADDCTVLRGEVRLVPDAERGGTGNV